MGNSTYEDSNDRRIREIREAMKAKDDARIAQGAKENAKFSRVAKPKETFVQFSQYKGAPTIMQDYNAQGSPFTIVKAKSETRRMVIPSYTEDLSQADYDKAKKLSQDPTVLEAMRKKRGNSKLTSQELESELLSEMLKNSNPALKQAAGGKEDYDLRSVVGLPNLQSTGERSTYNADNAIAHRHALDYLPTGLTYDELVERGISQDHGAGVMVAGGMLIAWGAASANQKGVSAGKRIFAMGLGSSTNYLAQVLFNPAGQEVDYKKVAVGGLTGGLSAPATLVQGFTIAAGGSLLGDGMNKSNPNAGLAATAVAVPFGFGMGKVFETSAGKVLVDKWVVNTAKDVRWEQAAQAAARRNLYAEAARSAGHTGVRSTRIPQKPVLNSSMPIVKKVHPAPPILGNVFGNAVNDGSSKILENEFTKLFKGENPNEAK